MQIEEILVPKNSLWRVLSDNTPIRMKKNQVEMVNRTLHFLSMALTKISHFQTEHKLFDGEFKFNSMEYR